MVFHDKEFGDIIIRRNARVKSIIARRKENHYLFTIPANFHIKMFYDVLEQMRPRLRKMKTPSIKKKINENTLINTITIPITIELSNRVKYISTLLKKDSGVVLVSDSIDINEDSVQNNLIIAINKLLYQEAERELIPRTWSFAQNVNLNINSVKISKSKGRWGSCSSKRNINLSLYLMLMPDKLVNYVILHELAHIVEMNHSDKFWNILDKFCGEDSRALGRIARRYHNEYLDILK